MLSLLVGLGVGAWRSHLQPDATSTLSTAHHESFGRLSTLTPEEHGVWHLTIPGNLPSGEHEGGISPSFMHSRMSRWR